MLKQTIQITLFSILGIGVTFALQVLLSYYFGAGEERDAHFAALTIPSYVTLLFTGSIGVLLVPFLVKHHAQNDISQEMKFSSSVLNICLVLLLIIAVAGYFFAAPIIDIMVPESRPTFRNTAIHLFRIQICSIFFTVLSNLLGAIFQARHSFFAPALFPIITNVTTLVFVLIFSNTIGISSVAYGTLCGSIISFFFMGVRVMNQFRFKWQLAFFHPGLKQIMAASIPLFGAGILFRSTTVIERFFAARLPEGGLSYIGSGNQIIVVLSTVVSSGIATSSFPLLSKYWLENNLQLLEKTFIRLLNLIVLIILPMIVIFLANGTDLISLIFERGAFTSKDTIALYYVLAILMGYFLFSSIGSIVGKMLYLSQNTWAMAIIAIIELVAYVILALVLIQKYHYLGLAISLSLSSMLNIILSLILLKRKVIDFHSRFLLKSIGGLLLLSIIVFLMAYFVNTYVLGDADRFVRSVISSLLIIILYLVLLSMIFKNLEVITIIQFVKQKFFKNHSKK